MPDTITGRISAQVRFEEPMDVGIFRRDIERSGIKCGADSIAPLSSGNLADPYTRGFGMPHQAFAKRQEFEPTTGQGQAATGFDYIAKLVAGVIH